MNMLVNAILCSLLVVNVVSTTAFVKMESMIPRNTFVKINRADGSILHEVLIAIKQRNLDVLESKVLDISTPGSKNYQNWMTFNEVGNITSNFEGAQFALDYFTKQSADVKVTWVSRRKEYIKATAPVFVWEKLFNTEFFFWVDKSPYSNYQGKYILAEEYSIPTELATHVEAVFYTVQTPLVIRKQQLTALPKFISAEFDVDKSKSNEHKTVVTPNARALKAAARKIKKVQRTEADTDDASDGVTVAYLNEFYNISSNIGSTEATQSVLGENFFSNEDLTIFQKDYKLTIQAAIAPYGGDVDFCDPAIDFCGAEGNIDIQYLMGVSQVSISYWWLATGTNSTTSTNVFLAFVTELADDEDPPFVNSISYGTIEQEVSASILSSFNTETMKLASMGVTILAASGDNGVANYGAESSCEEKEPYTTTNCPCQANSGSSISSWTGTGTWSGTGYFPSFPATAPYVTAVGATMGTNSVKGVVPPVGGTESGCMSNNDDVPTGVITSGGGFSTYYPQPSWQTAAVTAWSSSLTSATAPAAGYNKNGRGFPDVALLGVAYQVVIHGEITTQYGTGCATPAFAAMVSLVNAARLAAGLTTVGFINPTLYANQSSFNDVTSGFNNCGSGPTGLHPEFQCCTAGFYAQSGWDPMTGLGSINMNQLLSILGA